MSRALFWLAASLVSMILLVMSLQTQRMARFHEELLSGTPPLVLLCAASNRSVMEAIRQDYRQRHGIEIDVQYGPSQTLLTSINLTRQGDLYLPADDSYLIPAAEKKLVRDIVPVATMRLVLVVARGNPRAIHSLQDLLRDDVRLVQASPDVAAVGKLTRDVLQPQNLWESIDRATAAYRPSVTEALSDVRLGSADAAFGYDALLTALPDLEIVPCPELQETTARISVATLTTSRQPAAARAFARYLTEEQGGRRRYREFGFTPATDEPNEGQRP